MSGAPPKQKPVDREALIEERARLLGLRSDLQSALEKIKARLSAIDGQLGEAPVPAAKAAPAGAAEQVSVAVEAPKFPPPATEEATPLTREAIAASIIGKVGHMSREPGIASEGLLPEENDFLKSRLGISSIEVVPVKALETNPDKRSEGVAPFYPKFFLRVRLVDGTVCAMTQVAFRRTLICAMPEAPLHEIWDNDKGLGRVETRKELSGFFKFETFKVQSGEGHKKYLKDRFGAVLHTHTEPSGGYEVMARFNWHFEQKSWAGEEGSRVVIGHDFIAWVRHHPLLDEAPRLFGESVVEIGASETDHKRITEVLGDGTDKEKLKKIREIMDGVVHPELEAILGMAAWSDPTELVRAE